MNMKKPLFLLAAVACSLLSHAQTNQVVWDNGRVQYAAPIVNIDSLTYLGTIPESDTLCFILPRSTERVVRDTITVTQTETIVKHDTITVTQTETIVKYDTVYILVADKTPDGVLAVDLGLPSGIKWASCNIGTTTPEGSGDFYAWGEVKTKANYAWSTYKYAKNSKNKLTKYCTKSTYGYNDFTDDKKTLELEDDAAHVNWGGVWRMPTSAEWTELINNCTWTWTTQNNVNGYLVKSNTNNNSIFLPAAGYYTGTTLTNAGSNGYYWSTSLSVSATPYNARAREVDSTNQGSNSTNRCYGLSIRPVCQ